MSFDKFVAGAPCAVGRQCSFAVTVPRGAQAVEAARPRSAARQGICPGDGQAERGIWTGKDATAGRFHDDRRIRLCSHLGYVMAAHTSARRLKPLGGLTPHAEICKIRTSKPD